jgi:hypothetical protein
LDAAKKDSYPGSGTVWNDLSGNNAKATFTGSGISYSNNAIFLNGTSNWMSIPYSSLYEFCNASNDLPFTLTTFIYLNSLGYSIINAGDSGGGAYESYTMYTDTSGKLGVTLYDSAGPNQSVLMTNNQLQLSTWYECTYTYSGTGGNNGLNIYINGVLQTSTTKSSAGTYTRMRVQSPSNVTLWVNSFGSTGPYKGVSNNGGMSNLKIYNRALSAAEITQNYNALKSRYGL